MTSVFLYPRLPTHVAARIFSEIQPLSVSQLRTKAALLHADAIFAATGGTRVSDSVLHSLQNSTSRIASTHGYPDPAGARQLALFDAQAAVEMHRSLPISCGEASRDEAWSFITLIVLPDVARWRFPTSGEERFRGGVRNTFQRLWWRAESLVDSSTNESLEILRRLPEDAMVGIMERPGISSNPLLARTLASKTLELATQVPSGRFEDAYRDAFKRIRQRVPVVNLDVLDAQELDVQLSSVFADVGRTYGQVD